ncbi:MAG: NAD-dependent epimerase/dehydratase family protein [Alphaproteobacteria bacterium]|nr:NAD-dependent epimerase/dehydratase family protein [Alphaproteobacteria bacterium]
MVEKARRTRVLIFGAGVIGGHVCDLLSRMDDRFDLTVSARRADALSQRVNLSITSALCLGFDPRIEAVACDVFQTDACAALIDRVRPDIIVNATSLQTFWKSASCRRRPTGIWNARASARGCPITSPPRGR